MMRLCSYYASGYHCLLLFQGISNRFSAQNGRQTNLILFRSYEAIDAGPPFVVGAR